MTWERLEVLRGPRGWILTDHRQEPHIYQTSGEAVAMAILEAKRLAAEGIPAEVHLWDGGLSQVVFSTRASAQPT